MFGWFRKWKLKWKLRKWGIAPRTTVCPSYDWVQYKTRKVPYPHLMAYFNYADGEGKYVYYNIGDVVPMKAVGNEIAWYRIAKVEVFGIDWAIYDDGKTYTIEFHSFSKEDPIRIKYLQNRIVLRGDV